MASTKIKFRASSVSGKQGTLFIQVIHQRTARQFSTKYRLYPEEWDADRQSVVVPKDALPYRCQYLHALQEALRSDVLRLQLLILSLDHSRMRYCAEDVIQRFMNKVHTNDFVMFSETIIDKTREEGHLALASKYHTSLSSFKRFLNGRYLAFEGINTSLMLSYETYLRKLGLCPNTTSF